MKGFVPTPERTVDLMVELLFSESPPGESSCVLDPGSGRGAFVDGVIRYCSRRGLPVPTIVAVESDPEHAAHLRARFGGNARVVIEEDDFLTGQPREADYVIGNPPYVSILGLSESEKASYRARYETATGRFDLYLLFFEKALAGLKPGGRLVFITPEKYLYVNTASPLRRILAEQFAVSELLFQPEDTFPDLVTYPLVSVVDAAPQADRIRVVNRDGDVRLVEANLGPGSWLPTIRQVRATSGAPRLQDVAARISCGVATGADGVFTLPIDSLPADLRSFSYPTLAGREIVDLAPPRPRQAMLIPYRRDGSLLPESQLGSLGVYLREPARKERLLRRTCVRVKPWYAFHENPPLVDIFRPKLLCKDIGMEPRFVIDREGTIVPRHSTYYIVPHDPLILDELADFLNSASAARWFGDHCQRAAKGFLRVQSHVLKRLPLPPSLDGFVPQLSLAGSPSGGLRS